MLQQQMRMMEERLKNATTELLKLRSQELQQNNTTQMSAIINPLKETIGEMKKAMESTRDQGTKNTASLEKAIENVLSRAAEIGTKADSLANALKNENKMQGNWGEMILSELLESEGLQKGKHYSVQETLRDESGNALKNDESGKRMIPDVILHFPDNRDAIIDSKVSLSAFIDYQNSGDDEAVRNDALSRHIQSLRNHTEVTRKKADKSNMGEIAASLSGSVVKVLVEKGQAVTKGTPLIITEAMKMETTLSAPISGIVSIIHVAPGERVESGDCLMEIKTQVDK